MARVCNAGDIDLDASLREVMGDVASLKKAYQKQAGQQDQPTDQMYRYARLLCRRALYVPPTGTCA